ncbi:MAG: hypothetical protein P1U77_17535 [Rubripirellula sp.]|nr:hypothetical protein [Rubripirellula sp.]
MTLLTVKYSSEMNQCDWVALIFNVTRRYNCDVIDLAAEPMRSSPRPEYNGLSRVCYAFTILPKSECSHGEDTVYDWGEVHYSLVDRIVIKVRAYDQRRHC